MESNKTRIVGVRFSLTEYEKLGSMCEASTCRNLSEFLRKKALNKPVVTLTRDASMDSLLEELIRSKAELRSVGINFNQAVKRLHTLSHIQEFRAWLSTYERDRVLLEERVQGMQNIISRIGEIWLR